MTEEIMSEWTFAILMLIPIFVFILFEVFMMFSKRTSLCIPTTSEVFIAKPKKKRKK